LECYRARSPTLSIDINKGKHTPHQIPPQNRSYVPREILLNDDFASQSKLGWRNFIRGMISRKWGVLLTPKRKIDVKDAFERSMISLLWKK
jgi:hypothetical protein